VASGSPWKGLKNRREENRERIKARKAKYREENRSRLEKHREENREKISEYMAKYRKENKSKIYEREVKYRKENPDKNFIKAHRRLARKLALPDDLTSEQKVAISIRFNDACALTGDSESVHFDHVIPLASGHGGTIYGNMIPLRADLNYSKNDSNIFEWFDINKNRLNLPQERFDTLIAYLAEINGMTVNEYCDYVYWCHANPRNIDAE
jgi:hypothetical protein